MIKVIVKKLVAKYGMKGLIVKIGDYAVTQTKSKDDDKIWKEVKKVLEKF